VRPNCTERLGVEVVPSHNELDYNFPHYNPNPEAMEMPHDMSDSVKASGADFALGFDGDGDRYGVVDEEGEEIFADKVGVIMARDLAKIYPNSTIVADVKSTGLFASDPELIKYDTLDRLVAKLVAKCDAGELIANRAIKEIVTVNGARVILDNGAWGLVRASSNTPNLVVVCESPESEAEMRVIFADINAIIRTESSVGEYDQTI
jgi:phosphomannomutase